MKKSIGGSVCDTEKARLLGAFASCEDQGSLTWTRESLYRTKSGKYFLHCEGNSNTIYAERTGDGWYSPGQQIRLISEAAAKNWAEQHMSGDEYEAAFGEVEERTVVSVLPATRRKLEKLKADTGMSYCEIIDKAVTQYVAK